MSGDQSTGPLTAPGGMAVAYGVAMGPYDHPGVPAPFLPPVKPDPGFNPSGILYPDLRQNMVILPNGLGDAVVAVKAALAEQKRAEAAYEASATAIRDARDVAERASLAFEAARESVKKAEQASLDAAVAVDDAKAKHEEAIQALGKIAGGG